MVDFGRNFYSCQVYDWTRKDYQIVDCMVASRVRMNAVYGYYPEQSGFFPFMQNLVALQDALNPGHDTDSFFEMPTPSGQHVFEGKVIKNVFILLTPGQGASWQSGALRRGNLGKISFGTASDNEAWQSIGVEQCRMRPLVYHRADRISWYLPGGTTGSVLAQVETIDLFNPLVVRHRYREQAEYAPLVFDENGFYTDFPPFWSDGNTYPPRLP